MDIFSLTSRSDKETTLRTVSNSLVARGYVKSSYPDALIEREVKHPTGLQVEDLINIAIPHADVEHVLKPSLVVIKQADTPLFFQRMDEPDEAIPVEIVFLLVVKDPDGYVNFLAEFTSLFKDQDFIRSLSEADPAEICQLLKTTLDGFDLAYQGEIAT